jgi:lysozyme
MAISRRQAIAGLGSFFFWKRSASAQTSSGEIDLTNDDTRGMLGELDLRLSGVVNVRAAMQAFVFPTNADDGKPYGIDVSHHNDTFPWKSLNNTKVSYAYVKASQGIRGRDDRFEDNWRGASQVANIPVGAYHFLTAGLSGKDQAEYFLNRLKAVGGLKKGCLQPVVDLEWDTLGPNFKKVVIGRTRDGKPIYKDYWEDIPSEEIADNVQSFIDIVTASFGDLKVVPRIYTNRSWWLPRVGNKVRFRNCKIWISDYRKTSYNSQQPLSVPGHEYDLWQFTETGKIRINGKDGPQVDCNKYLEDSLSGLLI